MKKNFIIIFSFISFISFISFSQSVVIPDSGFYKNTENIPLSELIVFYDNYFSDLEDSELDLDSVEGFEQYRRSIEAYRYCTNFPNFSLKDYKDNYHDWIRTEGVPEHCLISEKYP